MRTSREEWKPRWHSLDREGWPEPYWGGIQNVNGESTLRFVL